MEEPMSTMITIPAPLVEHAREGTIYLFGKAGLDIAGQAELRDHELAEPLARLDSFRALLEVLPTDPDTAAQVGMERLPALCEALREQARTFFDAAQTAREEGHAEVADTYAAKLDDVQAFVSALAACGQS
jgi:hypothetical protein